MSTTPDRAAVALAAYRAANPASRAVSQFRFGKNSGSSKTQVCVFCGAEGPSWSARYHKTVRAVTWEQQHSTICPEQQP